MEGQSAFEGLVIVVERGRHPRLADVQADSKRLTRSRLSRRDYFTLDLGFIKHESGR